jgi:NAD(P)-dependent dehydrogenase (short-subunit alcohol dehydrogenase family)
MKKLKNKVAIITGGSGEIGYTTAKVIANRGAKVMLVDLDQESLKKKVESARAEGLDMSYTVADVTKREDVKNYINQTIETYGKINLFFNNAGVAGEVHALEDYPEEVFDKVIAVNVKGVFLGLKYVIPKIEDGSSIVITSSIAGLIGMAGKVAYHSSKHAIVGMMRTAAKEVADRNIRVNTVHPGPVDSPMVSKIEAGMEKMGLENAHEAVIDMIPLKRVAQPEDISKMVAFLFSDDAAYSTASTFVVDGGMVG